MKMVFCRNIVYFLIILLVVSCGNRRSPTGGPTDTVRPEIKFTSPLEFEQIEKNEIIISFSKPMEKNTVTSGIHINPVNISRRLIWKKNDLHIVFNEKLPENANVLVFLNKSIKCDRGNYLEDHIIMTFRNGILQQNTVSGSISYEEERFMNQEVTMTLLDSDSLLVFNQVVTEPFYQFNYLNTGQFTLNAYIDLNNNKRFNFAQEPSFSQTFELPLHENLDIFLTTADTLRPRIDNVTSPFNDQIVISFNKELPSIPKLVITHDSLDVKVDIIHQEMIEKRLFLVTTGLDSLNYLVRINHLQDSKGNETKDQEKEFQSQGTSDTKPPKITQTQPRNGNVIRDSRPNITITFDKIMFVNDVKVSLVEVETSQPIPLNIPIKAGFTLSFIPNQDLREFNSYLFTISADTKDKNGNHIEEEMVVQFIKL